MKQRSCFYPQDIEGGMLGIIFYETAKLFSSLEESFQFKEEIKSRTRKNSNF